MQWPIGLTRPWSAPLRRAPTKPITILLADDHDLTREVLRTLIGGADGLRLVGEAADGRTALELARELEPGVVLMDVVMPGLSGVEATRRLTAELPDVRVLAISMHKDRRFVGAMLEAGAAGYLLKDDAAEELVAAVRAVAAGESYLSPAANGLSAKPDLPP